MIKIKELTEAYLEKEVVISGVITHSFEESKTNEGVNFHKIMVSDETGNIHTTIFADANDVQRKIVKSLAEFKQGDQVEIRGIIKGIKTKGRTINKIEILQLDRAIQSNGHSYNLEKIKKSLTDQFLKIKDPSLRQIVKDVLNKFPEYKTVPYSYNAFAFTGGLQCYMDKMFKCYEALSTCLDANYDEDLIRCAIYIHRIGKTQKMLCDLDGKVEVSLLGQIGSDTAETIAITYPIIDNSKLTYEDKCLLKSVIGSTKGKLMWGATNDIVVPEAYLIHYLEQLVLSDSEFDEAFMRSGSSDMTKGSHGKTIYKLRRSKLAKK